MGDHAGSQTKATQRKPPPHNHEHKQHERHHLLRPAGERAEALVGEGQAHTPSQTRGAMYVVLRCCVISRGPARGHLH